MKGILVLCKLDGEERKRDYSYNSLSVERGEIERLQLQQPLCREGRDRETTATTASLQRGEIDRLKLQQPLSDSTDTAWNGTVSFCRRNGLE